MSISKEEKIDLNQIIGYQSSTIMQNANPTNYEQNNIGLIEPLNYVHLKKIIIFRDLIHPFPD